jgi:hypothetical protein
MIAEFLYIHGADILSVIFLIIIVAVGVKSRRKQQRYVK